MRSSLWSHVGIAFASALLVAVFFNLKQTIYEPQTPSVCQMISNKSLKVPINFYQSGAHYKALPFDFKTVQGISEKQLSQHHTLYQGYVNKFNEIQSQLQIVGSEKGNTTYSKIRALKVAETFALNGTILHELYFENITNGSGTTMGENTKKLITTYFGSLEKFKENLLTVASSARGWVLTGYTFYDDTMRNYLLDAHNELVPLLTMPLLVVDTYEHAYMIDFGINRAEYLEILWKNINWNVVEQRVNKWLEAYTA